MNWNRESSYSTDKIVGGRKNAMKFELWPNTFLRKKVLQGVNVLALHKRNKTNFILRGLHGVGTCGGPNSSQIEPEISPSNENVPLLMIGFKKKICDKHHIAGESGTWFQVLGALEQQPDARGPLSKCCHRSPQKIKAKCLWSKSHGGLTPTFWPRVAKRFYLEVWFPTQRIHPGIRTEICLRKPLPQHNKVSTIWDVGASLQCQLCWQLEHDCSSTMFGAVPLSCAQSLKSPRWQKKSLCQKCNSWKIEPINFATPPGSQTLGYKTLHSET